MKGKRQVLIDFYASKTTKFYFIYGNSTLYGGNKLKILGRKFGGTQKVTQKM